MQFYREERKYIHRRQRKDKQKRKLSSSYLAPRFSIYPPNIEYKNGIRFTNQRRRGDKKEDRRPEEGHGQEGARGSLSRGSFFDRIPIFFYCLSLCRAPPKILVERKRREKNATKNDFGATKKRKTQPHRASRIRPKTALSTP